MGLYSRLGGIPSVPYEHPKGGAEPGSSQWCLETAREAAGTNWNAGGAPQTPGTLLCWAGATALAQDAWRQWGYPPWRPSGATWTWCWVPCLVARLGLGLGQIDTELSSNLNHFMITEANQCARHRRKLLKSIIDVEKT